MTRIKKPNKITIEHYLNTNLKGYIINGKPHYSVYMHVSMQRKNTRLKSYFFCEYYCLDDWQEMIKDKDCTNDIVKETTVITNILRTSESMFKEFDPLLLSYIYSNKEATAKEILINKWQYKDIRTIEQRAEGDLYGIGNKGLFGSRYYIKITAEILFDTIKNTLELHNNNITIYDWFTDNTQAEIKNAILTMCGNVDTISSEVITFAEDTRQILNKIITNNVITYKTELPKKYQSLANRYANIFDVFRDANTELWATLNSF